MLPPRLVGVPGLSSAPRCAQEKQRFAAAALEDLGPCEGCLLSSLHRGDVLHHLLMLSGKLLHNFPSLMAQCARQSCAWGPL